jgi:hypothetical protein
MADILVLVDYPPWYHKSVLAWSSVKTRQWIHCCHLNSWLLYKQWNFSNLAPMETGMCQIIKYSRLWNSTYNGQSSYRQYLGTFTKLQKVTISFVSYVRLHGLAWFPLDRFCWSLIFHNFSKSFTEVQVALQSARITGTSGEDQYMCVCLCLCACTTVVTLCCWSQLCIYYSILLLLLGCYYISLQNLPFVWILISLNLLVMHNLITLQNML